MSCNIYQVLWLLAMTNLGTAVYFFAQIRRTAELARAVGYEDGYDAGRVGARRELQARMEATNELH